MRNIEKVRRSAASNLLVQFPLAELTLQLVVDPSKSRRAIPARADGRSQQKPTVDPSKSRRLILTFDIRASLHSGIMSHSSARGDSDGRRLSLSLPARRPRRGGERVIERVIEKSSSAGIVYPTLTRTNYTEWSLVMKVNL
jgi:hypothetical protein